MNVDVSVIYTQMYLMCIDIDECTANRDRCKFGDCVNLPGGYSCTCNTGYGGNFCDTGNDTAHKRKYVCF